MIHVIQNIILGIYGILFVAIFILISIISKRIIDVSDALYKSISSSDAITSAIDGLMSKNENLGNIREFEQRKMENLADETRISLDDEENK